MCQAKLYLQRDGERELLASEVTYLEMTPEGVRFATFFDEPKTLKGRLVDIDFLKHTIVLTPEE